MIHRRQIAIAQRLREQELIPDEEVNDSLVLAESALLGCTMLLTSDEHPAYRLTVSGEANGWVEPLQGLNGVLKVEQIEGRPEYRIEFDETQLDTNGLLQGIIGLNIPVAAFAEDKRHLNEAFMDLTERGVK